jgi:DNA topoisomerase-3
MDRLFEVSFSPIGETGKPFSKCGKCKRYMHLISMRWLLVDGRSSRLYCKTCNEAYALPGNGSIKLYKELKCPIDDFELILFSKGTKEKGFPVCPHCYNQPPFEGIESEMSCNLCPKDDCPHSMKFNWVSLCPADGCTGSLVLDATSAPHWKVLLLNFS